MSSLTHDEELDRRLRVIWINADSKESWALHRYVPKSLDGGTGWDVWDKKRGRFLKRKEIKRLTFDDCSEKFVQ
jgi:hypothetical protein